jgi:hypothetical protein
MPRLLRTRPLAWHDLRGGQTTHIHCTSEIPIGSTWRIDHKRSRKEGLHPSPITKVTPSAFIVHPSQRTIVLYTTTIAGAMPPLYRNNMGFRVPDRTLVVRLVDQFEDIQELHISSALEGVRQTNIGVDVVARCGPHTVRTRCDICDRAIVNLGYVLPSHSSAN